MDIIFAEFNLATIIITLCISLFAGFIKGASGFAYPMIMLSGLGVLFEPQQAVAYLIFPLLVVNAIQCLQFGVNEARKIFQKYIRITAILCLFLILSSPLIIILPKSSVYLLVGIPITIVAILQLLGWKFHLQQKHRNSIEYLTGALAGVCGGFAGVWAPLIVPYLLAINPSKKEYILAQGVIYTTGSIVLIVAHLNLSILNLETTPTSLTLIIPSVVGLYIGILFNARLNHHRFRQLVLVILALAGINLIFQGLN